MLRELADIGMEMARALQGEVRARDEAVEDKAPRSVAELGLAFSRVSRAVRQTLALEARLEDDRLAREQTAEDSQSQRTSEIAEVAARVRARAARIVADAEAREAAEADHEDLSDGPDVERGEGFVADRPAADVVAGVCGDLGLKPDLGLWADEDGATSGRLAGASDQASAPVAPLAQRRGEPAAIAPPHPDESRGRPP